MWHTDSKTGLEQFSSQQRVEIGTEGEFHLTLSCTKTTFWFSIMELLWTQNIICIIWDFQESWNSQPDQNITIQIPNNYAFGLDTKGGKTNHFDLWFKNIIAGPTESFQIEWGQTSVVGLIGLFDRHRVHICMPKVSENKFPLALHISPGLFFP